MGSYENSGYSRGGVSPMANGYIDSGDTKAHNIKEMMNHYYNSAYPQAAAFWQQGSIDKRFKVGDQQLNSMIYGDNAWYQSRRFYFNLVRRHINMICGHQRKNRKSTITMPTQDDTDPLVDDYNKVLKWSENRDGFHEYFSQAFEGAMDTGLSMLNMYLDYTNDPISGDLCTDQVSYNNILMDANWRKQDLSDCAFAWRRRWVNKGAAKALLPGHAKEIDKMNVMSAKDGRFPLQAELLNLNVSSLMCYDEFHYRDTREATIILDPKSGEAVEWEPQDDEDPETLNMIMQQQPWLKIKKQQVPTVKLAICLGGKTVYDGENLLRIDSYPMVPLLCYHEPDIQSYAWKFQGIVRNLRDAQYLYNMRKVIELDILQSQINSGWIYPIDSVVDPKAFRQSGQGFLIPLKAGHLPQEIQRVEAPSIPQSMMELSRSLSEDITKISGVNEELLGAADDDKSGILAALRQGAGLVTLQTVFDKADYSQRLYGKIRLQAIRKNFSKGKVQSILGHEPDPRFFTSHSLKYSIAVEEGNYSTTQRQMELQQLLHFKEIGIPISNKSILQAAFISNKKQVIEDMEAEQQAQQQAQQAEQQAQQQVDQSKIMQAYTASQLNMAKVQEALAKVDDLEGSAEHKKAEADLNIVKMMVELEDMDLANFRESLAMAETIKMTNGGKSSHPLFKEEQIQPKAGA